MDTQPASLKTTQRAATRPDQTVENPSYVEAILSAPSCSELPVQLGWELETRWGGTVTPPNWTGTDGRRPEIVDADKLPTQLDGVDRRPR